MKPDELKLRTKKFALSIIKLYRCLPKGKDAEVIGYQMLRSGNSVGANYRTACRARSEADFISKITIVEEADETAYWIELLIESGIMKKESLESLLKEANELTAIFTASGRTAKSKRVNPQSKIRNPQSKNNVFN